jgi:hypothetical protein
MKRVPSGPIPGSIPPGSGQETPDEGSSSAMEEYLTTLELSQRIKMAPGTIRNLMWKRELKENVHFLRPTPRKILFIWSGVQEWLHRKSTGGSLQSGESSKSLINI